MKLTITIYKEGGNWYWSAHLRGKHLAASRGYPRIGPLLTNLRLVMGIKVNRHLRVYETPIKEEGAYSITGRIQPPIQFEISVRR